MAAVICDSGIIIAKPNSLKRERIICSCSADALRDDISVILDNSEMAVLGIILKIVRSYPRHFAKASKVTPAAIDMTTCSGRNLIDFTTISINHGFTAKITQSATSTAF